MADGPRASSASPVARAGVPKRGRCGGGGVPAAPAGRNQLSLQAPAESPAYAWAAGMVWTIFS
jgi:hypothetical protein